MEENPKIKHYNSLLKISKRTDYNKSYFKLANYTKNIPKSDEVKDVTYQNSLEKTFACSCLEFEQSSVNPDSTLPCMCEGELVIGWKQLWTYMLSIGFKKDYITEVKYLTWSYVIRAGSKITLD